MTGPNRTPSTATPRQSWLPEQAPKGVTCPACGLTNEDGARVCRNCGLPIASAVDPLRGVKPGRVDMPSTQRSGLSAAIGLALVVGLLLVGGTLAASGGGILNIGGRLGVDALESPALEAVADGEPADGGPADGEPADGGPADGAPEQASAPDGSETVATGGEDGSGGAGTSFEYTCENGAIRDLSGARWFLSQYRAGERVTDDETFERITWEMSRTPGGAKKGTTATMEWTTPKEARTTYGASLVSGTKALVVTFDGPIEITAGQRLDQVSLEPENVQEIRTIDMFVGEDGKVRSVIGIRGDSCARMSSLGWTRKSDSRNARVFLDVERS